MRLIHTDTLELKEFPPGQIPEYAILSHTWEDGEVTFQDWRDLYSASTKPGFEKIRQACRRAQADGLQYLWADTNCIDKSSSAELSEAINSMFVWYQDSTVCYAFLGDVQGTSLDTRISRAIAESRWFTRGWTLQELLAPPCLVFFSSGWTKIGTRASLSHLISKRTGISGNCLIHNKADQQWALSSASIAQKMSWVATRTTTRPEDMAYCMLGIFGVNMPLLYGEGMRAFIRLQEEIIKISTDQTIFCWEWIPSLMPRGWVGMLAPSPALFKSSREYGPNTMDAFGYSDTIPNTSTFSITNAGLSLIRPTVHIGDREFIFLSAETGRGRYACIAISPRQSSTDATWRLPEPSRPVAISLGWSRPPTQFYVLSSKSGSNHLLEWTRIHLSRGGHAVMLCFDITSRAISTYPTHHESQRILPLIQTGNGEASGLVMVATKFRNIIAGIFFKVRFSRPGNNKHSRWSCHLFRVTSEILWEQRRVWEECKKLFGPLQGEQSQTSNALNIAVDITSYDGQFLLDGVNVRLARISHFAAQKRQQSILDFFDRIWDETELEGMMEATEED